MIFIEAAQKKREGKKISWTLLSEVLNAEGPSIKASVQWKDVNKAILLFKILIVH